MLLAAAAAGGKVRRPTVPVTARKMSANCIKVILLQLLSMNKRVEVTRLH